MTFVKNSSNDFINHLIEKFHFKSRSISNQIEQWKGFSQSQNSASIDDNNKMNFKGISNVWTKKFNKTLRSNANSIVSIKTNRLFSWFLDSKGVLHLVVNVLVYIFIYLNFGFVLMYAVYARFTMRSENFPILHCVLCVVLVLSRLTTDNRNTYFSSLLLLLVLLKIPALSAHCFSNCIIYVWNHKIF